MTEYQIYHDAAVRYYKLRDAFGNTIKIMHYEETKGFATSIRMAAYADGFADGWNKAARAIQPVHVATRTRELT